jgi:predicted DsbA family dithiol-disulfide isomerase
MNAAAPKSVSIDVVSDAVCPWCYIGKRNLEAALAAMPDVKAEVHWRPYQLDATIPAEGIDRRAYLERKFGSRVGEIYNRVTEAGAGAGIAFKFDAIRRSPNTLDAHRLIRWSWSAGAQDAMVERLFRDFFIDGKDIGDRAVLIEAARACGMDANVVADLLARDDDVKEVQTEIASAQNLGVTGVPFFIIDGRFGLPGAQPPDVLQRAIAKALQKSAEEAEAS